MSPTFTISQAGGHTEMTQVFYWWVKSAIRALFILLLNSWASQMRVAFKEHSWNNIPTGLAWQLFKCATMCSVIFHRLLEWGKAWCTLVQLPRDWKCCLPRYVVKSRRGGKQLSLLWQAVLLEYLYNNCAIQSEALLSLDFMNTKYN